ncbi:MAG: type II toxin-antitoxin system VapC family toxin [Lentisphaerae bacterium]|jgi:PIN domain nuclease of toxin-antitoxin system|nr:type II toxin-antitoxin system VapC family toxin [Lentisphaerota bacterium]MBT4820711.1 type II toxin-antitoxin system VapC family toxin [Lentisphaerota bacterium]MBT5612358.1 type II toxin-antitoxin system VapC family toxin [Lentisphaerota bacterium]MBT7056662.1 type II toxin-antitoxin system VapC family toxin [Lentisphaerota bacterium]MBT7840587.1 type II toxin-antitoxin system VapC family toxin [Lentisphaerota bacterium]
MRIIVDTHIFLWGLSTPERIDSRRRHELESPANIVYVSSVSIAEIMIKASIGKLEIDFDPVAAAILTGFEMLDFSGKEALLLRDMPFHHRDPFDRMLIAQSLANRFPLMTDDRRFEEYDCRLI